MRRLRRLQFRRWRNGVAQLKAPRGTILVDTREQNPFDFSRFEGWFAGVEKKALKLGDYSVAGLEDRCVVERKALPELVHSLTLERPIFINRLKRICNYPHRLLVITATLSQVRQAIPTAPPIPTTSSNPQLLFSRVSPYPSYVLTMKLWEKNSWLPTSIKCISITGSKPMTTADSWLTAIFDELIRGRSQSVGEILFLRFSIRD